MLVNMRLDSIFKIACLSVLVPLLCAQDSDTQAKSGASNATQGLPPRASPADYQAKAKAGAVTIAAEFAGHAIPTAEGTLSVEDYVVVEAALFDGTGEKLSLSFNDFSLRINGKKAPVQREHYEVVGQSVRDPEWGPPAPSQKSKTSLTGGGGGGGDLTVPPPTPVKPPPEVQRALMQRVKKTSLAEGDRVLPQAGFLYFPYSGKITSLRSIELIYSGPAGHATLALTP